MKSIKLVKNTALALACAGMLIPQTPLRAADATPASSVAVNHVSLNDAGAFTGKVVNAQGEILAGTKVVFVQDNKLVAETTTSPTGEFSVNNLKGGIYLVATEQSQGMYHVWPNRIAPPNAGKQALIVSDPSVTRGQFFGGMGSFLANPFIITAIVATAIAVPVVIHNNLSNEIDELEDQIDNMNASP